MKNRFVYKFKNYGIYKIKFIQQCLHIVRVIVDDMVRCDLFKHASAMSYVTVFSLIPSLAAIFGVISFFKPVLGKDSVIISQIKSFILNNLATGTGEVVVQYVDNFISNLDLTNIGITGFAGTIVSLALLLKQIEVAFNKIWYVKQARNIFTRFIYFWTFLTLGTFILGITLGILSGFNLKNLIPFVGNTQYYSNPFISFFVTWVGIFVFFVVLYKIVPNCFVPLKYAISGALPSSILFFLAGKFYSIYVTSFTNYKIVYGALWAIPVFLMWIYILWVIALGGALLSWRIQKSFILEKDPLKDNENLSYDKKYVNYRIQTILPYLVIFAICYRFLKADGVGLSLKEIIRSFKLPPAWIMDVLDFLVDLKLVIRRSPLDNDEEYYESQYFPAIPLEKLMIKDLIQKIGRPFIEWVNGWDCACDLNYKSLLKNIIIDLNYNYDFEHKSVLDVIKNNIN